MDGRIKKTPGVCGGDACVRDTRITVWGLVESRRAGQSDAEILANIRGLTQDDLDAAWEYARQHPQEIETALWENAAIMLEHGGSPPVWFLVRGRQLGLSDERIRDAFEPPLAQEALDAAWREYDAHREEVEDALRAHAEV
jgi:uncharacterized protein (DUF433 family)